MIDTPKKLPSWKKAVIKVGSALVAPDGNGCKTRYLLPIAGFIAACMHQGKEVILVSSGAVAAGRSALKRDNLAVPRTIPEKQALAAIGQSQLMATWGRFFDVPCAQMLLTYDDLKNRRRFVNAKNALAELLHMGALPIINENDTVATDELRVGDNDNLAAHVAVLAEADLLIIFSDVKGLHDKNPRKHSDAVLLREVTEITTDIYALAGPSHHAVGTGGMVTKLQAADKAGARGIDTIIANGYDPASFEALLAGVCPGTFFNRTTNPTNARKHWMQHALPTCGTIEVDAGARKALLVDGASLLPSGVIGIAGQFRHGDAVDVCFQGVAIAKGLCQYDADNLIRIMGRKSSEIVDILGFSYRDVIIHRGDMVVFSPNDKDCVAPDATSSK